MSERQERMRAKLWKSQHEETHEKQLKELQKLKIKLDALEVNSKEYNDLKQKYDSDYKSAEEFYMKFYEC